jgi:uncharacterized tellurite resistance protein B-like protein
MLHKHRGSSPPPSRGGDGGDEDEDPASFASGPELMLYRELLEMAMADGDVAVGESDRLRRARQKYGIAPAQHDQLLTQVAIGHASMNFRRDSVDGSLIPTNLPRASSVGGMQLSGALDGVEQRPRAATTTTTTTTPTAVVAPVTVAIAADGTMASPAPAALRKVALNGMDVTMAEAKLAEDALRENKKERVEEAELTDSILKDAEAASEDNGEDEDEDEDGSEYESTDDEGE